MLRKVRNLKAFLPEIEEIVTDRYDCDAVIGWGRKSSSTKAIHTANTLGVPYIAIEDGFLRSLDLGVNGEQPLSLVVDRTGIYYDASEPSDIERMIADAPELSTESKERAAQVMTRIRQARLSKYNHADDRPLSPHTLHRPRILLVDQTLNDASVSCGMASETSFRRMMEAAIDENPDAEILIKTHPDVLAGKKSGYLASVSLHPNCRVISEDINPWALFSTVSKVYVVTSQLGIEALFAGLPVRCFGMPFYAGWGLTIDDLACSRRVARPNLVELFAAAYMSYARYIDPFTNELTDIENTIDTLTLWKQHNDRNAGATVAVGFSSWKRKQVSRFLRSTRGKVYFIRNPHRAIAVAKKHKARIITWASKTPPGLEATAQAAGITVARMEDGFVRSVGLGAQFTPAYSLVLDERGLYFDPRRESDLEYILSTTTFDDRLLRRAAALRELIVSTGVSKYNVGDGTVELPGASRTILVPGQVEDDQSVLVGCKDIKSNLALLQAARAAEPNATIVFKPHPDVESGLRKGFVSEKEARQYADLIVTGVSITDLLSKVDAVHTMTSLVGFEALLRDKEVYTYGSPFYAGWGLTRDRQQISRRKRRLSLDELVAGTLLLYPIYIDPISGRFCPPEVLVKRFSTGYREPPTLYKRYRQLLGTALRLLNNKSV
jgi:capsular polysaccharide export protein